MAEKKAGLGSRSAVMFVAFAVDRVLGFLLIVLITRWWAPVEVGYWTQAITLTGALGTIASMGLYQAHIRFAEESTEPRIRHSLQLTILSVTTGALLIAAAVAAIIPGPFSRTVFGVATETRLLAAVFALAMSELWTEFVTVQLRAEVDARGAALIMGGKAVLRVILIGSFAILGRETVSFAVFGLAAAQWIGAVAVIVARLGGTRWLGAGFAPARDLFARALKMALPMIPAAVAAQAYVSTERFALARFHPGTIAHFNIGQQFASNAMMAYVILGSMFYPMLVRAWRTGRETSVAPMLGEILVTYALVSVPALLVLPTISRELVPLLTTRYYEVGPASFFCLMLGAAGLGVHQLAGYVFYVRERTWELLALLVLGFAAKLVCAVVFIAPFGEHGGVVSSAVGGAVLSIATIVRARQLVSFTIPFARLTRIALASLGAAGVVATVSWTLPSHSNTLVLTVAAASLLAYAAVVRKELVNVFRANTTG